MERKATTKSVDSNSGGWELGSGKGERLGLGLLATASVGPAVSARLQEFKKQFLLRRLRAYVVCLGLNFSYRLLALDD